MPGALRRLLPATVTAASALTVVLSTGGTAGAQIPGVDPTSTVVVADSTLVQVAVSPPDLVRQSVSMSIQNNTSAQITCNGIRSGTDGSTTTSAATVATSEIVARSVSYYAKYPRTNDPILTIPVGSSGGNAITVVAALGSITEIIPGSVTGGLRPEFGERGRISELYTAARLAGQVGTVASLTLPARSGVVVEVPLGYPSAGPRVDFTAGAVVGCQISGQDYLFAGYQGGATPSIPLGSLSSSDAGRFGS